MLAQNPVTAAEPLGTLSRVAKKSAVRILVVDDELLVRWSVGEALRSRGFDVVEAVDATSALRLFDLGCDLVLLDLHLPDCDDLRVLSFMRHQSPAVPVIVMTAFATRELAEDAAALGASMVPKPFDLDDLTDAVEQAIAERVY